MSIFHRCGLSELIAIIYLTTISEIILSSPGGLATKNVRRAPEVGFELLLSEFHALGGGKSRRFCLSPRRRRLDRRRVSRKEQ